MSVVDLDPEDLRVSAAPCGGKASRAVFAFPLLGVAALVVAWQVFDLDALNSEQAVAQLARTLRGSTFSVAYVLGGFALGTLLFLPITALIVGTTLAFGPLLGFAYALLGVGVAACATYWAGRWLGAASVERLTGPRMAKVAMGLRSQAFRASVLARLMPVGNFTAINLVAGSMRIPFRAFLLGTLVGALPGLVILTMFADSMMNAIGAPTPQHAAYALAGIAGSVALALLLRRALSKRARRS